ncbi:hypothetical protein [Nocardioides endophyticus]|uniref:hypothetical protein n=1 Tax=Nocardioides endophyticus TaxID=1353775 RepID=UPI0031E7A52F
MSTPGGVGYTPDAEEYVAGSVSAAETSSYRLSTHDLASADQYTGASSRSSR